MTARLREVIILEPQVTLIQPLEEIQITITVMLGIQETVMLVLPVHNLANQFKLVEEPVGLGKIPIQID
jgi:hypothetical protein